MKKFLTLFGYGFLLATMGVFVAFGVASICIGITKIFVSALGIFAIIIGLIVAGYFLLKLGEIAADSNEARKEKPNELDRR